MKRFLLFGGINRTDLRGGFRDFIGMSDDEQELKNLIDKSKLKWYQVVDTKEFTRKSELVPRQLISKYGNRIMNSAIENKLEL